MKDESPQRPPGFEEAVERFLGLQRGPRPVGAREFAAAHAELGPDLIDALAAIEALEVVRAHGIAERIDGELGSVGPFRLIREIGRGGMGVVFEAIEVPLGRRVALKVLPAELLTSASARARFRREAELASRLEHSGICTVYGAGVDAERPWIAMRYVAGNTLARLISRARNQGESGLDLGGGGRDARAHAVAIAACVARVARALQVAHENGVVHRDVKPANVMIDGDGAPVLLDFGLAREEESDAPSLTRTGETAGTPAYIPPEQLAGEIARPDALGDVYALGVTLYECLTLRRPFDSPTRAALYRQIVSGSVRDVRAQNRAIPRDLAVVVATAIERDRSRRYASAAALAADLESVVAGKPIAARPVPAIGRAVRWMRREPRQALLAGLLVTAVVGLAIAGGVMWASRDKVLAAERLGFERAVERELESGFLELTWGDGRPAEEAFARAQALDPSNLEAITGLALVSLAHKRDAEALERLEKAPRTNGIELLRALASGRAPMPDDDPERLARASALELFFEGKGLMMQAQRSPVSERRAISRRALDRLTEAVVRATTARALYHSERALAAREAGDAAAAHSAANALLQLWPDSAYSHSAAGYALYPADPRAGRRVLERSIELDPRRMSTWRSLANACIAMQDWEGAERAARRALDLAPADTASLGTLGSVLIRRGCATEAVPVLRTAIAANPDRFELLANLGMLELQIQDDEQAEHHLRRALAIDWNHGVLHESLAILLLERDAYAEARGEFEVALALRPTSVRALEGLGAALLGENELVAALEAFDAVMQKRPPDAGLHVYRAMALTRLGRDLEGYAALQKAEHLEAEHPGLARMEADCLLRAGDAGGAALAFARAVAEKDEPASWAGLGQASDQLGDTAYARACFERALDLDACHGDASYALAEVLAALGASHEAAQQLARAACADPARASSGLRSVRMRASEPLTLEHELVSAALDGSDDSLARALFGRIDDR